MSEGVTEQESVVGRERGSRRTSEYHCGGGGVRLSVSGGVCD